MICPKCGNQMEITHTFTAGEHAKTQRLECKKCNMVGTAQTILVNVNPDRGEGAKALADKLRKQGYKVQVPSD